MAQTLSLTGADIVLFINNKRYNAVQSITLRVDYGEIPTYGIDSPYAQTIGITKVTVTGSIQGVRTKQSGGLQGISARPLFLNVSDTSYVSIRIQDRGTQEDIVFIPQCMVSNETHSIVAKKVYSLSFDFVGIVPFFALDRSP